jgi:hypothetical protein
MQSTIRTMGRASSYELLTIRCWLRGLIEFMTRMGAINYKARRILFYRENRLRIQIWENWFKLGLWRIGFDNFLFNQFIQVYSELRVLLYCTFQINLGMNYRCPPNPASNAVLVTEKFHRFSEAANNAETNLLAINPYQLQGYPPRLDRGWTWNFSLIMEECWA